MNIFFWILVFLGTFSAMEFMAWFTHKYIMHGFLWSLHKDHHHKDHKNWFERNDAFFIFYAVVSMTCFYFWSYEGFWTDTNFRSGSKYGEQLLYLPSIYRRSRRKHETSKIKFLLLQPWVVRLFL